MTEAEDITTNLLLAIEDPARYWEERCAIAEDKLKQAQLLASIFGTEDDYAGLVPALLALLGRGA